MDSYKSNYRAEVDGLRAFAVLSVVIFHAFPGWLAGGFIGVDVFFVISGFLITSHIFESLDKGQFSFVNFFGRRIRRLFPALILVMVASLAFAWFALLMDEYAQLGKHVASGAAFILNFILVDESGYFDNAAQTKPMLHLWSLAVEEQFYIIWPLVLWFAWRLRFNLLLITIIVAVISFYLNLKWVHLKPTEIFFWPVGRFWELLSGSILAWLMLYKADALSKIKHPSIIASKTLSTDGSSIANVMSFSGLCLLGYGVLQIHEGLAWPSQWTLIPVVGALLVIVAGSKAWLNRVLLMNPIAIWFGLISYPLYLWHWPVLSFLQIIDGEVPDTNARIVAVLLSILLSWLTYRFIESRMRHGQHLRFKTVFLMLLMVIVGAIGYQISINGLDKREWISQQKKINDDLSNVYKNNVGWLCDDLMENDKKIWCAYSRTKPKTVLLGDSHAPSLYLGLKQLYEEFDRGVAVLGSGGCPPLHNVVSKVGSGEDKRQCVERISSMLELIARTNYVEEVMLVSRGPLYTTADGFGGVKGDFSGWVLHLKDEPQHARSNEDVFLIGLTKTLDFLTKQNKKIVYVFDVPELNFDIKTCLSERYYFPRKNVRAPCALDIRQYEERNRHFKHIIGTLLADYPSVKIIDLSQALCNNVACLAGAGGRLYYRDHNHLNYFGSNFVVRQLKNELLELYK